MPPPSAKPELLLRVLLVTVRVALPPELPSL
jgi:hypothetical protein